MIYETNNLSHSGVKGMKWGYNRGRTNGGRTAQLYIKDRDGSNIADPNQTRSRLNKSIGKASSTGALGKRRADEAERDRNMMLEGKRRAEMNQHELDNRRQALKYKMDKMAGKHPSMQEQIKEPFDNAKKRIDYGKAKNEVGKFVKKQRAKRGYNYITNVIANGYAKTKKKK